MSAIPAQEIRVAIQESRPLTLRTVVVPHTFVEDLEGVLDVCLEVLGQERMKAGLFFCLQELVGNAKKANNKRVYFLDRKLEIKDPAQYDRGMREFRNDVSAAVEHYHKRLTELGYYVEVNIQRHPRGVELRVTNNIEMTPREHARIYDRIARSRAFANVEEAFGAVLDDTEGAGLGLTIVLLYLRKLGLGEEAFDLESSRGVTTARISIPFSEVHLKGLEVASERVVEEIDRLPTFPEHIVQLQKLVGDADANFQDIARLISRDPAFTADLLRYVNSAQFVLNRKVENVVDAVRVAGLRFLRNLLYSYGTHAIMADRYPRMRDLWAHAHRVAFYAYHLAKSILKDRHVADDVYVAGLLHDMGKIVIDYLYPKMRKSLEDFTEVRAVSASLVETILLGVSHAQLGGRVARKWNFPAVFADAIAYHHDPADAPPAHRAVVATVHLANALAHDDAFGRFERIDRQVLAQFGLDSVDTMEKVRQRLDAAYGAAADPQSTL